MKSLGNCRDLTRRLGRPRAVAAAETHAGHAPGRERSQRSAADAVVAHLRPLMSRRGSNALVRTVRMNAKRELWLGFPSGQARYPFT